MGNNEKSEYGAQHVRDVSWGIQFPKHDSNPRRW